MRKLASVQTIWDVQPIEGADKIEVVSVLGWKCVSKKGEFKKYDLCVYFEAELKSYHKKPTVQVFWIVGFVIIMTLTNRQDKEEVYRMA